MKTFGLLLLIQLGVSHVFAQQWSQMNDFPSNKRDDAASFTIGNIAYVGTGMDEGFIMHSDFYAYDMGTESWSQIQSLPDSARREYASAFSYNGYGYVFGGVNQSGDYLSDLWRYDPSLDTWEYIGETVLGGRSGAMVIMENDSVYFVGGKNNISFASEEVISYDISSGQWLTRASLPATLFRGISFEWAGYGYVGSGLSDSQALDPDFYRYKFSDDTWELVPSMQLQIPSSYTAFSQIDSSVYVCGGMDQSSMFNDAFQRINIPSQTSELLSVFPSSTRRGASGFSNSLDFYITTGLQTGGIRLKETWKAEHAVSLSEEESGAHYSHYIADDVIYFVSEKPISNVTFFGNDGRVSVELYNLDEYSLDISEYPNGVYYYLVSFGKTFGFQKLMIAR
ncbi:MAG: kelch repeat-containing protein [Crocinitomicaceae bacterium]|nr:kelch repeat-containing protein [Crocinitomicaceae bacterium]